MEPGIYFEVAIEIPKPLAHVKLKHSFFDEVLRTWIDTGVTPRGVKVEILNWRRGVGGSKNVVSNQKEARSRFRGVLWREQRVVFAAFGRVESYDRPCESQQDYDVAASPSLLPMWKLARILGIRLLGVRFDRTRRGWHTVASWNRDFTSGEKVALQALLGSDSRREAFNLMRVLSGKKDRRWNVLYNLKVEA